MKPGGNSAVSAQRAPRGTEDEDPKRALFRKLDYFPTPPWAARAGAELLRTLDPQAKRVWEPACGEGHMAEPSREYFDVWPSDIHPFGFGDVVDWLDESDFMDAVVRDVAADWILTNPPFPLATEFVRRGLQRARRGVALLLRLQFLEGSGRYSLLYGAQPLTRLAVFAERVSMTLGQWDPESSLATGYAWFFWMKGAAPMPPLGIPPGTRDRLWRPDDAARFGCKRDAPLLEGMGA